MGIIRLKEMIREKGFKERDILSRDLTLWKVRMTMDNNMPTARLTLPQVDLELLSETSTG
jgi:hypothetical protein